MAPVTTHPRTTAKSLGLPHDLTNRPITPRVLGVPTVSAAGDVAPTYNDAARDNQLTYRYVFRD